jgi:hypothetical protein
MFRFLHFFKAKPTLKIEVPTELMQVMHYYEDTCVMSCCGIACLNLDPQRVVKNMLDIGLPAAEIGITQLEQLMDLIRSHDGRVLSDGNGFEHRWPNSEKALAFVQDVHTSLSIAVKQVREHGLPHDETSANTNNS